MITIFKSSDNGLSHLSEFAPGSWVSAIDPDPAEIALLRDKLGVPEDFIRHPLDMDERARTEKEDGAMLVILRVPHFVGEAADLPYVTVPLGIILLDQQVVTICKTDSSILRELSSERGRGVRTAKKTQFVLHLLLFTADRFLSYLGDINHAVDALEDRLQASLRNREVLELLKYQKCLTYFTTALTQNDLLIQRLTSHKLFHQYPEDEDLLEDAQIEIQQALEMTNIASGILSQMMDAFASIISNNLNVVMKFLASATIILALPTLIASVYGMNVGLPLAQHPLAFWGILLVSVLLAAVTIMVFIRRDWL